MISTRYQTATLRSDKSWAMTRLKTLVEIHHIQKAISIICTSGWGLHENLQIPHIRDGMTWDCWIWPPRCWATWDLSLSRNCQIQKHKYLKTCYKWEQGMPLTSVSWRSLARRCRLSLQRFCSSKPPRRTAAPLLSFEAQSMYCSDPTTKWGNALQLGCEENLLAWKNVYGLTCSSSKAKPRLTKHFGNMRMEGRLEIDAKSQSLDFKAWRKIQYCLSEVKTSKKGMSLRENVLECELTISWIMSHRTSEYRVSRSVFRKQGLNSLGTDLWESSACLFGRLRWWILAELDRLFCLDVISARRPPAILPVQRSLLSPRVTQLPSNQSQRHTFIREGDQDHQ